MLDRVEYPQPGVGAVARHQHHLDPGLAKTGVQAQELLHQGEGVTGFEHFVFVFDLVLAIGFNALGQVQAVTLAEVEQRSGGDGDDQFVA
ncbi:hypothetical protein D3C84_1044050 [compost metagenome]